MEALKDAVTLTAEWHKYVPAGFEGPPTNVVEALKYGRALLEEEGRWIKSEWFSNPHPEVDPDTPFCNSWGTCAEGAVLVTTVGVARVPAHLLPSNCTCEVCQEKAVLPDGSAWVAYDNPSTEAEVFGWSQEDLKLYQQAKMWLTKAGKILFPDSRAWRAHQFNDSAVFSREDVLRWFDKAIEMAAKEPTGD